MAAQNRASQRMSFSPMNLAASASATLPRATAFHLTSIGMRKIDMRKGILIAAALILGAQSASADTVKIGVLLGFTGPIESLTPPMADAAELAISEASDSGQFLGGTTIEAVRGDSTCIDAAAATASAEQLVNSDNVAAIMGADCSGVTTAVANQVAVPNGLVMISPSATSPALSTLDDNDLFFRTAPSDARQGQVLADVVMSRGISSVAISYHEQRLRKGPRRFLPVGL